MIGLESPNEILRSLEKLTNWFVKQAKVLRSRKCLQFTERKLGSVYSGDLKLIFVRMLRRPLPISHVSNMSAVCGWTLKFNYALNDAVAKNDLNIMTIMSRNGPEHYDR